MAASSDSDMRSAQVPDRQRAVSQKFEQPSSTQADRICEYTNPAHRSNKLFASRLAIRRVIGKELQNRWKSGLSSHLSRRRIEAVRERHADAVAAGRAARRPDGSPPTSRRVPGEALRHQALGLEHDQCLQIASAAARRDRGDRTRHQMLKSRHRAVNTEFSRRTWAAERKIATDRLAELVGFRHAHRSDRRRPDRPRQAFRRVRAMLSDRLQPRRRRRRSMLKTATQSWRDDNARDPPSARTPRPGRQRCRRAHRRRAQRSSTDAVMRCGVSDSRARFSKASTISASPASTASGSPYTAMNRWQAAPRIGIVEARQIVVNQ